MGTGREGYTERGGVGSGEGVEETKGEVSERG